jgi:hypothetical protein
MKIERQTTISIFLTPEEEKAFHTVDRILKQLQDTYVSEACFEAIRSGELFEIEELPRVRGVIGTIFENTHFRIK